MRVCTKCKTALSLDAFGKSKTGRDGLKSACKQCRSDKGKTYRSLNKDKIKLSSATYYINNKEKKKQYASLNKNKINENRRNSYKNPQRKLSLNMRSKLRKALSRNSKGGEAISELGCSIFFFKEYISKKFQKDMSWDNYGEWHLDHIVPLSSVDLTNKGNYRTLAHYINIQPLWAKDNIRKGNR